MAEGVGNAPTPAMPILFSRQVQPALSACLPVMVRVQELHLRPARSDPLADCGHYTLKWLQLDSHQHRNGYNRPPCYFELPGNG